MRSRRASSEVQESWSVTQTLYDGYPLIARFNRGAKSVAGSRELSIQIGIAIPFNNPRPDGLPTDDERAQLDGIEDLIKEQMAQHGLLVGVITTQGFREFVAYTGSDSWIPSFHQSLAAAVTTHRMQVMAQKDARWRVYRRFVH